MAILCTCEDTFILALRADITRQLLQIDKPGLRPVK